MCVCVCVCVYLNKSKQNKKVDHKRFGYDNLLQGIEFMKSVVKKATDV